MFDMSSDRAGDESSGTMTAADPWQRAYAALVEMGLASGLRVSTSWMYAAMGVARQPAREPNESDREFARRAQTWSLREFQPHVNRLRDELMEHHGLWLHSIGSSASRPGEWEIRNADAAPIVVRDAMRTVKKTIANSSSVLSGMNVDGLTDEQRAKHSDAIAKVAHLESLVKMSARRKTG